MLFVLQALGRTVFPTGVGISPRLQMSDQSQVIVFPAEVGIDRFEGQHEAFSPRMWG